MPIKKVLKEVAREAHDGRINLTITPGEGRRRYSLIWAVYVCAIPKGKLFELFWSEKVNKVCFSLRFVFGYSVLLTNEELLFFASTL